MSKQARKRERRAGREEFKKSVERRPPRLVQPITRDERGRSLADIRLTDLRELKLDTEEDTLSVTVRIPVGTEGIEGAPNEAFFEETFDLGDETLPEYLLRAVKELAMSAARAVRQGQAQLGDYPCASCTSACCRQPMKLTDSDIDRMAEADIDTSDDVIDHYSAESWSGYAGEFRMVPLGDRASVSSSKRALTNGETDSAWDDPEALACPFLTAEGCSIYEHRPDACRDFSAWSCDMHEDDAAKIDGHVRLRVVT